MLPPITPSPTTPIFAATCFLLGRRRCAVVLEAIQGFTGAGPRQHALVLAVAPLFHMNAGRIDVVEIDMATALFGNVRRQAHLDTGVLRRGDIVGAKTLQVVECATTRRDSA